VSDALETKFWTCLNASQAVHTIMDIGARDSSMPHLFPEARVALFEPMPSQAERLSAVWGTTPRVSVHPYGLGEDDTTLTYYTNTESFVKRRVHVQSHSPISLPIKSFGSALAELGWESIDFVKIDTEGYEYTILKSAKSLIDSHRIKFIQFEMGGTIFDVDITMHDIFALFDSSWRIYNIEDDALNLIQNAFTWNPSDWSNGNFFATWVPEEELKRLLSP
jgi:FkbM family methyltransferase